MHFPSPYSECKTMYVGQMFGQLPRHSKHRAGGDILLVVTGSRVSVPKSTPRL
jgi:hypothetical protein